jgi:hypothetical protein
MRRGFAIIALLVVIFGGIGIGVGAYRAGERNGITEGIEQVHVAQQNGQEVQVVHVVGDRGPYFFPGIFLFPLFLFGAFFLIGGIFRGAGRWGGHHHGPGPWNEEGRQRFEQKADEWHRRQHGDAPPAPTAPAS